MSTRPPSTDQPAYTCNVVNKVDEQRIALSEANCPAARLQPSNWWRHCRGECQASFCHFQSHFGGQHKVVSDSPARTDEDSQSKHPASSFSDWESYFTSLGESTGSHATREAAIAEAPRKNVRLSNQSIHLTVCVGVFLLDCIWGIAHLGSCSDKTLMLAQLWPFPEGVVPGCNKPVDWGIFLIHHMYRQNIGRANVRRKKADKQMHVLPNPSIPRTCKPSECNSGQMQGTGTGMPPTSIIQLRRVLSENGGIETVTRPVKIQ